MTEHFTPVAYCGKGHFCTVRSPICIVMFPFLISSKWFVNVYSLRAQFRALEREKFYIDEIWPNKFCYPLFSIYLYEF